MAGPARLAAAAAALMAASLGTAAANPGLCVVVHCSRELAACLADSVCRPWQTCIMACKTDDLACQTRCSDLYKPTDASAARINDFSACVISINHCVPQTHASCKVPDIAQSLAGNFNMSLLAGRWYVTRGWNPLFDCFDCQVHNFVVNEGVPKPLKGKLAYRVKRNLSCVAERDHGCDYLEREVEQSFEQDTANRGHLVNHGNSLEELHYADDWYILAAREGAYALVYYCGCNDAACGYGGAVLYTRGPHFDTLSVQDMQAIRAAVAAAGVAGFSFDALCAPSNYACGGTRSDTAAAALDDDTAVLLLA